MDRFKPSRLNQPYLLVFCVISKLFSGFGAVRHLRGKLNVGNPSTTALRKLTTEARTFIYTSKTISYSFVIEIKTDHLT